MVKRIKAKPSARKSRVLEAKGITPLAAETTCKIAAEADAIAAKLRVREPSERSTKIFCPACSSSAGYRREEPQGLRRIMAENSRSRFVDAWICSDCGVEEALKGFFWKDEALRNAATQKFVRPEFR